MMVGLPLSSGAGATTLRHGPTTMVRGRHLPAPVRHTPGYGALPTGRPTPSAPAKPSPIPADPTLYVVPNNPASVAMAAHPQDAAALNKIASQPTALWITENSDLDQLNGYLGDATTKGRTPTFVLYAIPHRDCGQYSAGGFADASSYRRFVDRIAGGLAGRPAMFVVEPDALPQLTICGLTTTQQAEREALIGYASQRLSAAGARVYLDAGGAYSNPAPVIAARLAAAGIGYAAGFSLNVSAFDSTAAELAYGHALSLLVGAKHFVVDTSRNGVGVPAGTPAGAFCNVAGLALGHRPTTSTGDPLADAFLWIKYPGESDGDCGSGAPYSGVFWLDYALGLADRSTD